MGIVKGAFGTTPALYYPQADRYYPVGRMDYITNQSKSERKEVNNLWN
ncbi:TPA: hypothetical protein ACKOVY_003419 [Clostridioides difficile]|nr:hypothetical protein [Clostridioides difficile]